VGTWSADQRHHPDEHLQRDLVRGRSVGLGSIKKIGVQNGSQRHSLASRSADHRYHSYASFRRALGCISERSMGRDILLWLLGVPITVIILLHLFGVLHW
jgi:hypothetical protein